LKVCKLFFIKLGRKEVHEQPVLTTVKQEKLVHSETVPIKKRKKLPSVKIEYEEYASALPQVL